MRSLRVGLTGLGRWGTNYIGAFRRAGVELSALCDVDETRLAWGRECVPRALATQSFDAMLDANLDAIVIATPGPTHAELASRALERGRHVLVEKPLALSIESADAMIALASRARLVLSVGHLSLASPAWSRALDEAGALRSFEAHRVSLGASRSKESALFGLASHDVASLVGPLRQTIARVRARSLDEALPDQAIALDAESTTGVVVRIHASRLGPARLRKVTLTGSRGHVTIDELASDGMLAGVDLLELSCRKFLGRIAGDGPGSRDGGGTRETFIDDASVGAEVVRVLVLAERSLERDGAWVEALRR